MQFSGNTSTLNVEISDKSGIAVPTAVNYIKSGEKEIENAVNEGITQFNTNATAKTTAYDNNAAAKLNAYNENDTVKTAAYNQNATEKTRAFNANATSKTADFNTNASDKTTAFDNNSSAKTTAFNTNATEKQAAVDESATAAAASAATSKQWAVGEPTEPTGNSSKYWAQSAAASASNMANRDLSNLSSDGQMIVDSVNSTISNCVLEIPQNLKLEFSNGTVTLKAGSTIVRSGSTYQTLTTTQDTSWTTTTMSNTKALIVVSNLGYSQTLYGWWNLNKVGSGSSLPADNTNYTIFFNTTDKEFYQWEDNNWVSKNYAYPLAVVEIDSQSVITGFAKDSNGNDMIFNGAGFIGHHAFVYPNVTVFYPNGYSDVKHLNSVKITTNKLYITELATNRNCLYVASYSSQVASIYRGADLNDKNLITINNEYHYITTENYIYSKTSSGYVQRPLTFFVDYTYNGTTVTDFTIRQPIRLATTEMLNNGLAQKQDTLTGAATTIASSDLTASKALISNSSGKVAVSNVTDTELGYLSGVTSAVQTQINAKADDNAVVKLTGNQTIAGSKTFTDKVTTQFNLLDYKGYYVQNSAIAKGTVPITNTGGQFTFQDTTGLGATARLGGCEVRYLSSGEIQATLQAFKPEANSSTRAEISIIYPALGDAYTSAPTPPINSNSTNIATTAYVNNKFQVVSALPASPDADTFYFIEES